MTVGHFCRDTEGSRGEVEIRRDNNSDVPGPAWAQSPGLGWASAGLGLSDLKPGPELRLGLGLGLIGLEPGLQI